MAGSVLVAGAGCRWQASTPSCLEGDSVNINLVRRRRATNMSYARCLVKHGDYGRPDHWSASPEGAILWMLHTPWPTVSTLLVLPRIDRPTNTAAMNYLAVPIFG